MYLSSQATIDIALYSLNDKIITNFIIWNTNMKKIDVNIENKKIGELFFEKDKNQYGFNYTKDYKPISLIMPYKS